VITKYICDTTQIVQPFISLVAITHTNCNNIFHIAVAHMAIDRFSSSEAFEDLKKYLTTPPTLVALEPHENLQLYMSATSNVISMAIVIKRGESGTNHKIQYPMYFINELLSDSKTRYFHIMKLAYALLIASHKLSHYFQAHQIEVHTSSTL
jgi:hypothetical protein